uniref:Uncharacterized protein n=1 Tax=Rhizophora mucronata TaxID=61149 RepID=A0A2P2MIJ9_RHIMU
MLTELTPFTYTHIWNTQHGTIARDSEFNFGYRI